MTATTKTPTFPVVSKGVRRNAETGIEILNDADGWYVKSFHADKGDMIAHYATQADAREVAVAEVKLMREQIAEAYAEALAEADRIEQAEADAEGAVEVAEGLEVVFRSTFSPDLVGIKWDVVETDAGLVKHADEGYAFVTLRTIVKGGRQGFKWAYRLAKLDDLRTLDGGRVVVEVSAPAADPEIEAEADAASEPFTEYARKQFPSVAAMVEGEQVERLGFRVRPNGIGTLWTHTLTGVMIGKFPGEAYAVTVPVRGAHVEVVAGFDEFPTFEAALDHAMTLVVRWTRQIQADHAEALDEAAHREGLAICASIPAEGRPAAVTELLTAAELLTDEHEHLAAVRAARKLYDELRAPKRELPIKVVRHADPVSFAENATEVPADVPGATAVSPWKIDGTDTINRAPGGRIFVHVWQSFNDAKTGFSTRVAAAWLDELRTPGGAARVTLPGYPR